MNDNLGIVTGHCLCESVRFELTLPTRWCAHCHCSMCRRFHGAGYVTWVGLPRDQFSIVAGADELRWFASSAGAERGFCGHCGSSMLFRSERWADEVHVTLANLDGPIDREPQAHAFFGTRVDWMPIDEALHVVRPQ